MKHYHGYMIDLDGTIYQGTRRIPAAKRFVERLQAAQQPFLFLTNNTTRQPAAVVANLAQNHDIHVTTANIYTAAQATVSYLQADADQHQRARTAYVIGEPALKSLLVQGGFDIYAEKPTYVVVALDYDFSYQKATRAVLAIQAGAHFVGTNADTLIPSEQGLLPSAGSLIDLIRYATQVQPVIVGKPNGLIVRNALAKLGISAKEALMVGDNYETDIRAGMAAGVDTLLVYSGVSKPADIKQKEQQPTHEIKSFDDWTI